MASVSNDGSKGNADSILVRGQGSISADGRFVTFLSGATNLVPGDTNGSADVFVRDTCFGAPAGCSPSTTLVSVASDGSQANYSSGESAISADGRYVAFVSRARNLLTQDPSGWDPSLRFDVFVHDMSTGTTVRLTTDSNDSLSTPAISANGRFVAWEFIEAKENNDFATGLRDIIVRNTATGSSALISVSSSGTRANGDSFNPTISDDGRFITFESAASNLVPDDTNASTDIFVRDRDVDGNGIFDEPNTPGLEDKVRTSRLSVAFDGSQSNRPSHNGAISADGRFAAFDSQSTNLVSGGTDGRPYVFLRDRGTPPPSLLIDDVSLAEGNQGTATVRFTVSLSAASTQTVTVDFATADGTATAGADYVANSGTLTFAPGETTKSISVAVNGDTVYEPDETFFVDLSNAANATIAHSQGTGTIVNDDPAQSLSIGDVQIKEGDSGTTNVTFTVTLSAASTATVTVDFATADGTATAGSDYVAQSGTLTFNPGETSKQLAIVINGDNTPEPDETFLVKLGLATNASIAKSQALGTILNDDPVLVTINEMITVSDTPALLPSAMVPIAETITVTDAPDVLPSAMVSVDEAIHVDDAPDVSNTPVGSAIIVVPVDTATLLGLAKLTFTSVTQAGITSLKMTSDGPTPPPGFEPGLPSRYFDLNTTATFTGNIQVCIDYSGVAFHDAPSMWHYTNGAWANITISVDPVQQSVCGSTPSLSPFALFQPIDVTPPTIHCASADGQWHAADVTLACTAGDAQSGLANAAEASFDLSTSVAAGTETNNATTDTRQICDKGGNCATAGPIGGNMIDKKPPAITITAPSGAYTLNQVVSASYGCVDGGSGLSAGSCQGPVASGGAVSTAAVGPHSFAVTSTDGVGNSSSASANYTVAYDVNLLYKVVAKQSGSTYPIKLQLTDAAGQNVSSAAIVLHGVGVVRASTGTSAPLDDSGNANPDSDFRYDAALGGYIFNLSLAGYQTGSYFLQFTAGNDPTVHNAAFQVK